ncbi:long-chain fatty acid--CoA ligase [Streptomyces mexicanus]|uniref:Long-chain fatty acid--CoA ligase n=1 Tax=Streptomyces mexicanus TaxID=178566 RepID=A0A7X1HXH1_9ACTN|nr:long-chain fatty acid--CoA ligase [Streptomyces mexicanus]
MGLRNQLEALLAAAPSSAPAVGLGDEWWTWGQIRTIAESTDELCDRLGLKEGARVGLLLQNRPEFVGLVIGVLMSGRCITTLNPLQPPARLSADIVKNAPPVVIGVRGVVNDVDVRAAIEGHGVAVLVEPDGSLSTGPAAPGVEEDYAPGTAVEMLTSGTTGPPKRVRLGYAQLDSAFAAQGRAGVPEFKQAVAIVSVPMVHISGLWHVVNTVLSGRRLVLLERFRTADWVAAVERYRPKVASLVPAALRSVVEADVPRESLSSLKAITAGTAACPPELVDAVLDKYGIRVLATYGATEFAGAVAGWTLGDHEKWYDSKRGSVGRPFKNVRLRVTDPGTGEPLATGEVGRLEVQSAQLAAGDQWTSTSDLGRIDEDGFVFITGRADSAIIRGGFKVQPETVQRALESHPGVRAAAVAGIADQRLGQVPVAAVELADGAEVGPAELLQMCRRDLMPYEVPVALEIVDRLPRTPSMKISRAEVAAIFEERPKRGGQA